MKIYELIETYLNNNGYYHVEITNFDREASTINFNYGNFKRVEDFKINIWDILEFMLEQNN